MRARSELAQPRRSSHPHTDFLHRIVRADDRPLLSDSTEASVTTSVSLISIPSLVVRHAFQELGDRLVPTAMAAQLHIYALLHEGEHSNIMLASSTTDNTPCAVKCFHLSTGPGHEVGESYMRRILQEKELLQASSGSPFVVSYIFSHIDSQRAYLGMEHVHGIDLFTYLGQRGPLDEPAAKLMAGELALAIGHLHGRGIVHADVKPENVCIDLQGHVKLLDFGSAVWLHTRPEAADMCVTPEIVAPEIIRGTYWDQMIDWWAFGCVLWEAITGVGPFWYPNQSALDMLTRIISADLAWSDFPEIEGDLTSLLGSLLQRDPADRIGAEPEGYHAILAHPWFMELSEEQLATRALNGLIQVEVNSLPIPAIQPTPPSVLAEQASLPSPQASRFDATWTPASYAVVASADDDDDNPELEAIREVFVNGRKASSSFVHRRRDKSHQASERLTASEPGRFQAVVKKRTMHMRADSELRMQLRQGCIKLAAGLGQ